MLQPARGLNRPPGDQKIKEQWEESASGFEGKWFKFDRTGLSLQRWCCSAALGESVSGLGLQPLAV